MRVFLDANVLFSAARWASPTGRLIDRVLSLPGWQGVTSPHALDEARRNLVRKRPNDLPGLDALAPRLQLTRDVLFPLPVELADKDRPLLCAAIRARCDRFATGDARDFGHLYGQTIQGVRVIDLLTLTDETLAAESPKR